MASAQFQLFPNAHKKRERQSCLTEPQIYKITRQQYFGYYPTCWERFPDGWGCPCPNPEKPDRRAAAPGGAGESEGPAIRPPVDDLRRPADRPGRRPNASGIPDLPTETSPFELEPKAPVRAPELPPDRRPGPAANLDPATNGPTASDAPSINVPLSDVRADPFADIPTTPPASLPSVDARPLLNVANPSSPVAAPEPVYTRAAPVQAPQRRSLLGSLWDRVRR
jgi:hypothetical protein